MKVRVRRERPSVVAWAVALAVTMGMVYVGTLGAGRVVETGSRVSERVTEEVTLEGVAVWFADLGVFEDEGAARVAAAEFAGRGAAGVVYTGGDGAHVLGAGYENEADAARIAERLAGQEGIQTGVLPLTAEGVSLRITAPKSDIDSIAGADAVLRVQLKQAATVALQVDRGEIGARSARLLAAVSRSEVLDALEKLKAVDGAAGNAVCAALMAEMERLAGDLQDAANGGEEGASLSGRLRACHVRGMLGLAEMLEGMRG